ncbi:MAG: hypothetical protein Udaeo2_28430 [Candidatus Udaeobacter sp.]|nr:MAG: hypothetical protein Udaeo2_28430 [Candidatus Udaeobacter sp.]
MTAEGGRLTGESCSCPTPPADSIVVVARDGVRRPRKGAGVRIAPMASMDLTRALYAVMFADAPAEKLEHGAGLSRGLQIATAALVADMVGGMQRTLDITVDYAKTRKQFGKPIGASRLSSTSALTCISKPRRPVSRILRGVGAAGAGARRGRGGVHRQDDASDASRAVGNRGIQIHGGMGFTWENDLHLYYRRAKSSRPRSATRHHRERIARLVID